LEGSEEWEGKGKGGVGVRIGVEFDDGGKEDDRRRVEELEGEVEMLREERDRAVAEMKSKENKRDKEREDERRRVEELEGQVKKLKDERVVMVAEMVSKEKKKDGEKLEDSKDASHLALKTELRRQRNRRQELEKEQECMVIQMTGLQLELKTQQKDFEKVKNQGYDETLREALRMEQEQRKADTELLRGAKTYTIRLENELVREKAKVQELSIELVAIKAKLRDPDDPARFTAEQNEWRAARGQEIRDLKEQVEGLKHHEEAYVSLEEELEKACEEVRYLRQQRENDTDKSEVEDEARRLRDENERLLDRENVFEKENESLKLRLQEEIFRRREGTPWPQRSDADFSLEFKRIGTMTHQWARANTRALDIHWTDEERTELIQALKNVMKIEDNASEITMKNQHGVYGSRSLLLEALLNHHISTTIFKNPFFFLSDSSARELKHLYEVAKYCKFSPHPIYNLSFSTNLSSSKRKSHFNLALRYSTYSPPSAPKT
jgi:hypothetical protein